MSIIRAILITLVAASVAMLPVAGSMAHAIPLRASLIAAPSDCCPEGKPCDKQTPNQCGGSAGCMLKCFNSPAAVVAPLGVVPMAWASEKSTLKTESVKAPSENPALPPPRV